MSLLYYIAIIEQLPTEGVVQPRCERQHLLHHHRRRVHHQDGAAQGGRVPPEAAARLLHGRH